MNEEDTKPVGRRRRAVAVEPVAEPAPPPPPSNPSLAEPAPRVQFESANAPKLRPVSPDVAAIVEMVHVSTTEIRATYERIKDAIDLGERRTESGWVRFKAEEAVQLLWDARRLYAAAKAERDAWERDNQIIFATHRLEANRVLQHEKSTGQRSKQITDADVETMCAAMFKDEWRDLEVSRARLKETVESLEHFVDVVDHWCQTTRKLVT